MNTYFENLTVGSHNLFILNTYVKFHVNQILFIISPSTFLCIILDYKSLKYKHLIDDITIDLCVDTQFCTHDLIKENDLNDHPCSSKIMIALHASICLCITCINSFIAYHKNDLEIQTVATVFPVFK